MFACAVARNVVRGGYFSLTCAQQIEGQDTEAVPYLIATSANFDLFISHINTGSAKGHNSVVDDLDLGTAAVASTSFVGILDGGNVFDDGCEVKGNTRIILVGNTEVLSNVCGGGNKGSVGGNTYVGVH